jgi:hypothetical protein
MVTCRMNCAYLAWRLLAVWLLQHMHGAGRQAQPALWPLPCPGPCCPLVDPNPNFHWQFGQWLRGSSQFWCCYSVAAAAALVNKMVNNKPLLSTIPATILLTTQCHILTYCHIVMKVKKPNNMQQFCHQYCF